MKTTVGYIRVSTSEQQESGHSLGNQLEKIQQYCALHDMELLETFEDDRSGKNTNRPGYQKMLEFLKQDQCPARVVVVVKLDRLYRSTADTLQGVQTFNDLGVQLCSIGENLDTKSAMGEFFLTLIAALAQMERRLISERTRDVMAKMRRDGRKTGPAPFGHRETLGPGGKRMIVSDAAEQAVITRLLGLRNGELRYTYADLAEYLNLAGVRTPREGLLRKGKPSRKRWYASTVRLVLTKAAKDRGEGAE